MNKKGTYLAEFPDINRKMMFRVSYERPSGFNGPFGLGCHTGVLSQLFLEGDPDTIQVLDPEKEKKIEKIQNEYTGRMATSVEEQNKMNMYLNTWTLPQDARDSLFNIIFEVYKHHPIVFMCDIINPNTKENPKHSAVNSTHEFAAKGFKTCFFVEYLIKNKLGLIVGSPIHFNGYKSSGGLSLAQGFMWITPNALKEVMPDSAFVSIPIENSWAAWYNSIKSCLGSQTGNEEYVLKNVVRDEKLHWWK